MVSLSLLFVIHVFLLLVICLSPLTIMARVYVDVNARLGPSWYDYGEWHTLPASGVPRGSRAVAGQRT